MNRYALNVTPIDGWQTWFAGSSTGVALSADAAGTIAKLDTAMAALSLSMQGSPSAVALETAAAIIALTITGDGVIGAQPIIAHPGYGQVDLTLTMSGTPSEWQAADGAAQMTLAATYGLPNPVVIPNTYMAAHRTCVVRVPPENNVMVVPAEEPMLVRVAQKLPAVPPMRMP